MSDQQTDEEIFDEVVEKTTVSREPIEVETTKPESKEASPQAAKPAPTVSESVAPTASTSGNTPGRLVMQWLTYAFWGWLSIAVMWLAGAVFTHVVAAETQNIADFIAYPLAAVVVLMIIAFGMDVWYARHEPAKKTGAATVIMVIHAVIFALAGIGALITGVFALINMSINAGVTRSPEGATVTLYTALVMLAVYGLLTVRTLLGGKKRMAVYVAWAGLGIISLVITIAGLVGPVAKANLTKQDRLIEKALPGVATAINDYASQKNELPRDLTGLDGYISSYNKEEVKTLIAKNVVTYTPDTKPASSQYDTKKGVSTYDDTLYTQQKVFYYRLCVTYKQKKGDGSNDTYRGYAMSSERGQVIPWVSTHGEGETCYDLQTQYTY
ncbi:MAG: hypothetical protein WAQ25_04725 [Candidatus Saccharimonas sp.]